MLASRFVMCWADEMEKKLLDAKRVSVSQTRLFAVSIVVLLIPDWWTKNPRQRLQVLKS